MDRDVGPISVWSAIGGNPARLLISSWPWRCLAYLASTAVVGLVSLVALVSVIALGVLTVPIVIGVFILGGLPTLGVVVGEIERRRLALMGTPSGGVQRPLGPWRRPLSDAAAWRALGYAVLLALVLWIVDAVVSVLVIVVVGVCVSAPLLAQVDQVVVGRWTFDSAAEALPFAVVAAPVSFVLGCYLVTTLAGAQSSLARILLEPREEELLDHVQQLRHSRRQLVDAFETERRRIERDLHDGVQQRLVALTMLLGRAELDVPDGEGLQLVRRAHDEAEAALADLRAVVRGVHPRVLTDLGLHAAVQEIADRMPIPVLVDVALDGRPSPQTEAAAYFVVSEGLANIAKHAGATRASVHARRDGDALIVSVTDDGCGSATVGDGSGLSGLGTRLDALGGTLDVVSPVGGPTHLRMECPWRG